MAELLIELFGEEIPARMQARAAEDLKRLVTEKLTAAGLTFSRAESFVTPRRLALVVDGLPLAQPDVREERKGPRVGSPQQAIDGFLKSANLTNIDQAEKRDTGKGEFWFAVITKSGAPTARILPGLIGEAIRALGWAKSMRFASQSFRWVRPLHGILAVFDGEALIGDFDLGDNDALAYRNTTHGHRFLAPAEFAVRNFADYKAKLLKAKVILDPADRLDAIGLKASKVVPRELHLVQDIALQNEVTGLVEWPVPLLGRIDDDYMDLPPEVLTTTMRVNQKYFALQDKTGKLAPHFLVVANIEAADGGKAIVAGNERVLRARLSDARFFWDQDRKTALADRVPALSGITWHAKLGTVGAKIGRMRGLAAFLSEKIEGGDAGLADRAAELAKADLTSGMVGEFPELQGIMGRYYARNEGLDPAICDAIADHYRPLGPGDACPTAPVSIAVALADKIDSLVGFFGIDERPTGSKDPFGLRRAALGIIRLILENRLRLDLRDVFGFAYSGYYDHGGGFAENRPKAVIALLMDFLADRLKAAWRDEGVRHDVVSAVFALGGDGDILRLRARVDALQAFIESADGANLLVAVRRAGNIVRIEEKKDKVQHNGAVDAGALVLAEEKALHQALERERIAALTAIGSEDFGAAMSAIARLRGPVDAFFDKVTVNDSDPALRANRLKLLSAIGATLSAVADFTKIEG